MSLVPSETVKKLQATLHAKAKDAPSYRFYSLYDKVYRRDVLAFAYRKCRANGGAPGVDGQTFADIEVYGGDRWLDELTDQLRTKTYHTVTSTNCRTGAAKQSAHLDPPPFRQSQSSPNTDLPKRLPPGLLHQQQGD